MVMSEGSTYQDIDLDISEDTKALLDQVNRFGTQVVRPAGIALDRLADPSEVIAPDSVLWDIHRKSRQLSLHTWRIPENLGGMAGTSITSGPVAEVLVTERLGYADARLAISLTVSTLPFATAALFPTQVMQQLARDFCEDKEAHMIGCWAVTEPDHGSDFS